MTLRRIKEKYISIIIFFITLISLLLLSQLKSDLYDLYLTEDLISILSNDILVLLSISIGFFISSLTYLFSMKDTKSGKTMRSSGAYNDVIKLYISAVKWSALGIIVTIFVRINLNSINFDFWGYRLDILLMFAVSISAISSWTIVVNLFILTVKIL